jgi:hypothetical protein
MPEPHSGQKRRWIDLPVSPDLVNVFSIPVILSTDARIATTVAKADPVKRWQSAQWHTPIKMGSVSAL